MPDMSKDHAKPIHDVINAVAQELAKPNGGDPEASTPPVIHSDNALEVHERAQHDLRLIHDSVTQACQIIIETASGLIDTHEESMNETARRVERHHELSQSVIGASQLFAEKLLELKRLAKL